MDSISPKEESSIIEIDLGIIVGRKNIMKADSDIPLDEFKQKYPIRVWKEINCLNPDEVDIKVVNDLSVLLDDINSKDVDFIHKGHNSCVDEHTLCVHYRKKKRIHCYTALHGYTLVE